MTEFEKSIIVDFHLTAADCNAQFELSLPMFVQNIVEVATAHATRLGVDYKRLQQDGNAWVLMRLTLDMKRMPRVNEDYRIDTWVESFNRRFSQRDFEVSAGKDGKLEIIGHVRTIWTVINSTTRQSASLDGLERLAEVITHRDIEFAKGIKVRPADFDNPLTISRPYQVVVSDIDTNRHLTSMRYFELMLDLWPLSQYDDNHVTYFEIAFSNEARYDDRLTVRRLDLEPGKSICALFRDETPCSLSTIQFTPR